jgi:hypothetical protein
MKIKYVMMTMAALFALGFAMHRGLTQVPGLGPTVIGPGLAPNVGTPVDPRSLSYYGGYYGGYEEEPSYSSSVSLYNVTFGPQDIPQTASKITTKLTTNYVTVQWDGEPRAVKTITIALTDKSNVVLTKQTITAMPARVSLKRTSKATGYTVNITYINGLSSSVVSPL